MATRTLKAEALSYRVPLMVEKFQVVAKKARKLGNGSISWTIGDYYDKLVPAAFAQKEYPRPHRLVEVTFDIPVIDGWEVLGVLARPLLAGDATFYGDEDTTLPKAWFDRDECQVCDHCKTNRRRKDTVVLRNTATGKMIKVGNSCLKDFLGHNPASALFGATLWGEFREIFQFIPPPGSNHTWDLTDFLAMTVAEVRTNGWVPASMRDGPSGAPVTVDVVTEGSAPYPTEHDEEMAVRMVAWARSLPQGSANDYLNNVQAVAQDGFVVPKTAGVAASIVAAYNRAHEPKPQDDSEFYGTKGERMTFEATLVGMTPFVGYYGNGMVCRFQGPAKSEMVWFATDSKPFGVLPVKVGDTLKVKATIKDHNVRNGRKQTILNRVNVL